MSAKILSSLSDDNRDLRKQIGCMNGIFQLFDRHGPLSGRRSSNKRLLSGGQHQKDPQSATRASTEKDPDSHKEKPRVSIESSQTSFSSSSCSSTFSSLDSNKKPQQETHSLRKINIIENPFHNKQQPSLIKGQTPDLRDFVKDSMYREAYGSPIKFMGKNEKKGRVLKPIDSPRPLFKPARIEGPTRILEKDDRIALPRLSYDGRESRTVKIKELPRLSLDSKVSSAKFSSNEPRLNFLGPLHQDSGSHNRSASLVAKLMGLNDFPGPVSFEESKVVTKIETRPKEVSKESQVTYTSPRVSQSDPVSAKPQFHNAIYAKKSTEKAPKIVPRLPSSVYGEIEKRITELQFKRSGKDLIALKQILEAMQKTRGKVESQEGESRNFTPQNRNRSVVPKRLNFSPSTIEPAKKTEKARYSNSTKDITPKNNRAKHSTRNLPPIDKKGILGTSEPLKSPRRMKVENCTTSGRSFGTLSPRFQQNLEVENRLNTPPPPSEAGRVKRRADKKDSQNRKQRVKSKDFQLSDDQMSDFSGETRYSSYQGDTASVKSESNNSLASQIETENSVSTLREHLPAVELTVKVQEQQPSPISVLDDIFYSEDSPSPVKKISTVFQDERPSSDEAEWYHETPTYLNCTTRADHSYKYNQKINGTKHLTHELELLSTVPDETAENHRYIDEILSTLGLLEETSFIPTANQVLPSRHLADPNTFNGEHTIINDQKTRKKIVFDMVNDIVGRKITSGRLFTVGKKMTSRQGIVKEVHLEVDRILATPGCNLDEEDDGLIRILGSDLMHQSEDWAEYSGEVPALVLDIERLIFKDLVNEVVTGEFIETREKRHCMKLFNK